MRMMHCGRCGARVFFDNTVCERCSARLGFVPAEITLVAFDETWQRLGTPGPAQKLCRNYDDFALPVCNWMLPADSSEDLCLSCRTTAVIPTLDKPENRLAWARIEQAKRRLFHGLLTLRLPLQNKQDDAEAGLSFEFLEALTPTESVLTGHAQGKITLNIAEADDAQREQARTSLGEPYRTLLGHFRHEVGHYYWDRLVSGSRRWLGEFRQLFGNERADYGQALQRHYASPATDWQLRYVSVYASSHPWEDWAECFAHYLHMQDAMETAAGWGLALANALPPPSTAVTPRPLDAKAPLPPQLIEQWLPLSQFVNSMDRCLGTRDSYPFVLPTPVIAKLDFIHRLVAAQTRRRRGILGRPDSPSVPTLTQGAPA